MCQTTVQQPVSFPLGYTQHLNSRPHLALVKESRQEPQLDTVLVFCGRPARSHIPPGTSQVQRNKNPTWQVRELPWLKASWPTEPVFLVITPQTRSIQGSTWANQVTRVATFRKAQIYGFVLGTSSSPNPDAAYQESFYHKQCRLVAFYSHQATRILHSHQKVKFSDRKGTSC